MTKPIEVEYIESGTFQGGEEDVFTAGIKYGETCVVLTKKDFALLKASHQAIKRIAKMSPVDGIDATSLAREVLK